MEQTVGNIRKIRADQIEEGMYLPDQCGRVIWTRIEDDPSWSTSLVTIGVRPSSGWIKTAWSFTATGGEMIAVDQDRTPCCGATLTGTEDGPACRSCYELYPSGIH